MAQADFTFAIVNVGEEAGGYWIENRSRVATNNVSFTNVTKELMVGDPPERKRLIIQVNGTKPMEVPAPMSPGKRQALKAAVFAMDGFLDFFQPLMEQRRMQAASKPIRSDADRARYAGNMSNQIALPATPILPSHPNASEVTNGTVPAPANPSATHPSAGWIANAVKVGNETVTVPAGTFECVHYTSDTNGVRTDVWISPKMSSSLPPFGLVKLTSPGFSKELQKVFEHETSQIIGDP